MEKVTSRAENCSARVTSPGSSQLGSDSSLIYSVTFNVNFDVFTFLFPTSTVVSVNLLYTIRIKILIMGPFVITENSQ